MPKKTTADQAIHIAVEKLKQERLRLSKELARVDDALSALGGLGSSPSTSTSNTRGTGRKRSKRKVSAIARKRMAEAARARWAAYRKEKGKEAKKAL